MSKYTIRSGMPKTVGSIAEKESYRPRQLLQRRAERSIPSRSTLEPLTLGTTGGDSLRSVMRSIRRREWRGQLPGDMPSRLPTTYLVYENDGIVGDIMIDIGDHRTWTRTESRRAALRARGVPDYNLSRIGRVIADVYRLHRHFERMLHHIQDDRRAGYTEMDGSVWAIPGPGVLERDLNNWVRMELSRVKLIHPDYFPRNTDFRNYSTRVRRYLSMLWQEAVNNAVDEAGLWADDFGMDDRGD